MNQPTAALLPFENELCPSSIWPQWTTETSM